MTGRGRWSMGWFLALAVLALAGAATAASWGGITPGETTRQQVEAVYGRPTRDRTEVVESRTVPEWTYTGDRMPPGVVRMVLNFGFIRDGAFTPDIVRSITLYTEPRAFTLLALTSGWGEPIAEGIESQTGRRILRYGSGLLAFVDKTGLGAEVMLFAPTPRP
jgi:hypothetical protein